MKSLGSIFTAESLPVEMQLEPRPQICNRDSGKDTAQKKSISPKAPNSYTNRCLLTVSIPRFYYKGQDRAASQLPDLLRCGDNSLTTASQAQPPTQRGQLHGLADSLYLCWWGAIRLSGLLELQNLEKEICSLSFGWDLQESIWRKKREKRS